MQTVAARVRPFRGTRRCLSPRARARPHRPVPAGTRPPTAPTVACSACPCAVEMPVHDERETQVFRVVDHAGEPRDAVDVAGLGAQYPLQRVAAEARRERAGLPRDREALVERGEARPRREVDDTPTSASQVTRLPGASPEPSRRGHCVHVDAACRAARTRSPRYRPRSVPSCATATPSFSAPASRPRSCRSRVRVAATISASGGDDDLRDLARSCWRDARPCRLRPP